MSKKDTNLQSHEPDSGGRAAWWLPAAVALVVFAVYVSTLYPSVSGGDSGELIVAAYELGVAHPPGYPLYTLTGKLATMLPVGSVAWRVNLLTALFGAAAAGLLCHIGRRLNDSNGAGLLTAGLFAFSPLAWRYSVGAEVFSLNNLFVSLLIALLVAFEMERRERLVYLFAFVLGLGLTNHHTLLFCGAPIGLWMVLRARPSLLAPLPLLKLVGAGLAGLTPYLYLLVRPAAHPATTWGDTSTVAGFWTHLTRAEYGTLRLAATDRGADLGQNLLAYARQLPGELLWIGVPLALLAVPLLRGAWRQTAVLRALLIALGVYLIVFQSLSNMPLDDPLFAEVHARFAQQANLIVAVLAGAGFWWLLRFRLRWSPLVLTGTALALVGIQVGTGYSAANQRDNTVIADLARATLEAMPPGALVVSRGDLLWNSLRYQQIGEGRRPDVRLLDMELLESPWFNALVAEHLPEVSLPGHAYHKPSAAPTDGYDLDALFDANIERSPVLSNGLDAEDSSWSTDYLAWPLGLYDRLLPVDTPIDVDDYIARTDAWLGGVQDELTRHHPAGSWEALARQQLVEFEARRGTQLLSLAIQRGLEPHQLRRTGRILEHALELDADPEPSLLLNAGIYYYLARGVETGAVDSMVRVWRRYLDATPGDDPERRMVLRVLEDPANARLEVGAR